MTIIPTELRNLAWESADQNRSNGPSWRPLIWALLSGRAGDNAQVLALADSLKLPYETRQFVNRPGAIPVGLFFGAGFPQMVRIVEPEHSAPWPDLIIAAGTQSEPICALIKKCARKAGHDVKVTFLGRPWHAPSEYDLIVTTPQYCVPPASNVLEIALPLHKVSKQSALKAAEPWHARLQHLPRPFIMVALGGNINRYTLDTLAARRLAIQANQLAASLGGSVLVCNSYRTPPCAIETVRRFITCPTYVHDWRATPSENPYLSFIGLADIFIVTGDSMTMLAEAAEMRKPLYIFDLGEGSLGMHNAVSNIAGVSRDLPWLICRARAVVKDAKVRLIGKFLPARLVRDTNPIRSYLINAGYAAWLGDEFKGDRRKAPPNVIQPVTRRVRELLNAVTVVRLGSPVARNGLQPTTIMRG